MRRGDGTAYGSVVQVTCEIGYVKDPNVRESTCTTAGEWEPPIPACVGKQSLLSSDEYTCGGGGGGSGGDDGGGGGSGGDDGGGGGGGYDSYVNNNKETMTITTR